MLQTIMAWWLILTISITGAYDVWAILMSRPNSTVSYELHILGERWPALYLFLGVLIGHVIFPLVIQDHEKK